MKFANRSGAPRVIFFELNDILKVVNQFMQVIDYRNIPSVKLDLTLVGAVVVGSPSAGSLAAGTPAAPTLSALQTTLNNATILSLVPEVDKEPPIMRMVHLLAGIMPGNAIAFGVAGATRTIGCEVRYFNPQAIVHWLGPNGQIQEGVDFEESPVDDPNELFPIFIFQNNTPAFQAANKSPAVNSCVVDLQGRMYRLKPIDPPPAGTPFREIPLSEIAQQCGVLG